VEEHHPKKDVQVVNRELQDAGHQFGWQPLEFELLRRRLVVLRHVERHRERTRLTTPVIIGGVRSHVRPADSFAQDGAMPFLTVDNARLYFQEHGTGDPLVWAHEFSGTGDAFCANLPPALGDRYRVIAPDLRGHGRSTGAPDTIRLDRFAADLVALLDHLDIERAHLVGFSVGAQAFLILATQHLPRVRTLALVGAAHVWDEGIRARIRALGANLSAQPGWIDWQRQLHDAVHGPDHWQVLYERLRAWADDPAVPPFQPADLAAITCPVLVIHGDGDSIYPIHVATALYQALPNAELAVVPRTGHGPHMERPALFAHLLTDFHARHAET
jgi:pimeloyl-ACP methyl ester carboxylesterase